MPEVKKLSKEELKKLLRPKQPSPETKERRRMVAEFKQFLSSLAPGEGGEIVLKEGENRQKIKNRLLRAAKEVGVELEFIRKRGRIVFRIPDEEEKKE